MHQAAFTTSIHIVRMNVLVAILNPKPSPHCSKNGGCLILGFPFRCHCCTQAQATIVANFNGECIDFTKVFMCAWLQIAIISSSMSTSCWYVCGWPFMHSLCMPRKLRWPLLSSCPTCLILFQSIAFCSSIYNILFSGFLVFRWLCLQLLSVCNLLFRLCFLLHSFLTCFILLQFITFYSSIYNIMFF